jgi:hypothetical protein
VSQEEVNFVSFVGVFDDTILILSASSNTPLPIALAKNCANILVVRGGQFHPVTMLKSVRRMLKDEPWSTIRDTSFLAVYRLTKMGAAALMV